VARAGETAQGLASRYRGRSRRSTHQACCAILTKPTSSNRSCCAIQVYSYLALSMADDVEANDLATYSRDRGAESRTTLVFIGLEWIALDDAPREELPPPRRSRRTSQACVFERKEKRTSSASGGAGAACARPIGSAGRRV